MNKIAIIFLTLQLVFAQKKPNVIWVVADDLGYADLGCYGNPYIKTPKIDSIASQSVRFTRAYAPAPVCSPSRAALLTGRHPASIPITNYLEGTKGDTASPIVPATFLDGLPAGIPTVAHMFKNAGYTTGLIGKWHLGKGDQQQPCAMGFDVEKQCNNRIFYYDFTLTSCNGVVFTAQKNDHLTDILAQEANVFLEQNKEKPFFLMLNHFAPHVVLQNEPRRVTPYYFTYNAASQGKYDPQYAAMVSHLDEAIGTLWSRLKELQLDKNTVVIITSDNGGVTARELGVKPTDNSPLRNGKGSLYEGGIRVPLLIYDPVQWLLPSGTGIITKPVLTSDLYSSFCDALKSTQARNGLYGNSLQQRIQNTDFKAVWHYPHFSNQGGRPSSAFCWGSKKLLYFYETEQYELYNLDTDISENKNIALDYPNEVLQLKEMLWAELKQLGARYPTPKPSKK